MIWTAFFGAMVALVVVALGVDYLLNNGTRKSERELVGLNTTRETREEIAKLIRG